MKISLNNLRANSCILFIIGYLVLTVTDRTIIQFFLGLLVIVIITQSLNNLSKKNLSISAILSIAGMVLLISSGNQFNDWVSALNTNNGLLALFIVLPLFSFINAFDDYQGALSNLIEKTHIGGLGICILGTILAFTFGPILNIAAISLLYRLLVNDVNRFGMDKVLRVSLVRGHTAAAFWAPNFIAMAVVLNYVDISWIEIAPLGFFLSCIYLSIAIGFILLRSSTCECNNDEIKILLVKNKLYPARTASMKSIHNLFVIYIGLLFFVIMLNILTTFNILAIVVIVSIIYPLLVALILNKKNEFIIEALNFYRFTLNKPKPELMLYASVGFFSKALEVSGTGLWISRHLPIRNLPFSWLSIALIINSIALLSMIGVHPVISISVLTMTFGHESFGLSLRAFTYTLLVGYSMYGVVSPFSAMSLLLSGLSGKDPWESGPRYNLGFAFAITVVFSGILTYV